jgi:hypothetical protein
LPLAAVVFLAAGLRAGAALLLTAVFLAGWSLSTCLEIRSTCLERAAKDLETVFSWLCNFGMGISSLGFYFNIFLSGIIFSNSKTA